jgi:hypothetical protein
VLKFTVSGGTFSGLEITSACQTAVALDTSASGSSTMTAATWDVTAITFTLSGTTYTFDPSSPPSGAPFPISAASLTALHLNGLELAMTTLAMQGASESASSC